MWIFRYVACLVHRHFQVDVTSGDGHYRYCLRCGKVEESRQREPLSFGAR